MLRNDCLFVFHFVFNIKEDERGMTRMKARLVLHGNRDCDRYSVRRDWTSTDFSEVKLLLVIASILRFKVATANVIGANMQSGSIQREPYVRPPSRINIRIGTVCKLQRLAYSIVETGRQWLWVVESCMKNYIMQNACRELSCSLYSEGGRWTCRAFHSERCGWFFDGSVYASHGFLYRFIEQSFSARAHLKRIKFILFRIWYQKGTDWWYWVIHDRESLLYQAHRNLKFKA